MTAFEHKLYSGQLLNPSTAKDTCGRSSMHGDCSLYKNAIVINLCR